MRVSGWRESKEERRARPKRSLALVHSRVLRRPRSECRKVTKRWKVKRKVQGWAR